MAFSRAARRQLLAASVPEANEIRLELQDYLGRTGMAPPDFAHRINYSRVSVYNFLSGRYDRISSNDTRIRAAIRDFIAAHPIATPVISSGDPRAGGDLYSSSFGTGVSVYNFLSGRYDRISSNDTRIRAAIRDFIAAHPIATPVISSGDPRAGGDLYSSSFGTGAMAFPVSCRPGPAGHLRRRSSRDRAL